MDKFQRELVEVIYAAFEQPRYELPADFDLKRAVEMARSHNIAAIVYYGALNCGVSGDDPLMQELFSLTCKSMMVSQRQMYEIGRLEEAFEQAGIEYMPLKGTVLKGLYPQPEMRAMGDADILIRLEQYPKIEEIMSGLGFEFKRENGHELVWQTPSLYLELHKRVVPEDSKDFYRYFGTGWQLGERLTGRSRYDMSPENFFLYVFVHFTKHYRGYGIGIKHVLDLWVIRKTYPDLDVKYVYSELKKMNLHDFYTNVMETINVWLNQATANDKTDLITGVIFNSGQYGTSERGLINRAVLTYNGSSLRARFVKLRDGIFLPYKIMKTRYKAVEKCPILLPVMWVVRWFEILLFRRYVFRVQKEQSKMMAQKNMDETLRALQFVGLDINSNLSE